MSEKKKSRMDRLSERVEDLEQATALTFDMANKMRHIMTRLNNYEEAYEKYQKDIDNVAFEMNIDATKDAGK